MLALLFGALALRAPLAPLARPRGAVRMQDSNSGGAAVVIKDLDVWAGSTPLVLDVNWQVSARPQRARPDNPPEWMTHRSEAE